MSSPRRCTKVMQENAAGSQPKQRMTAVAATAEDEGPHLPASLIIAGLLCHACWSRPSARCSGAIQGAQQHVDAKDLDAKDSSAAVSSACSEPTNMTSGSFRSPAIPAAPSWLQQLQYRFRPAVSNAEAVATCKSAAKPPVSEVVVPRPAVSLREAAVTGEWRLIKNSKGEI